MVEESVEDAEAGIDQPCEVRLPGLGTAGYRWRVDGDGTDPGVDVTALPGRSERPSHAIGVSSDEVFAVSSHAEGDYTIRFVQERPWEHAPVGLHTVRLHVRTRSNR